MTTTRAVAGHLYRYGRDRVLAVQTGERDIRVLVLAPDSYWGVERICTVQPRYLTPLPMKYHGGHTP